MAIIRWNPMSDLTTLHGELDRLFGDLTEGLGLERLGDGARGARQAFLPVDVERGPDAVVIHASVPGFKPEEVSVTVGDGVLTIEAEHKEESERTERAVVRRERFHGRLFRQVRLSDEVRGDEATARFEQGVLTVTVPLVPVVEPKRIPVEAVAD